MTAIARAFSLVRLTAPVAALLSCCLALSCLVNQRDVGVHLGQLADRNPRFAGWLALGALLGVAAAAGCLLGASWVGPGPGMALATVTAVSGLTVARESVGDQGLGIGLLLLELSAGGLLGASLSTTLDLPRRKAVLTLAGWGLPLVAGWPVLAWLEARRLTTSGEGSAGEPATIPLTVHPPGWLLALVAVSLMAWAVLAMLVEPAVRPSVRLGSSAWVLPLTGLVCGVLLVLALVGLSPGISVAWLRPTLIVAALGLFAGWGLVVAAIGPSEVALAVVAVSVAGWSLPSVMSFELGVVATGPAGLPWWVPVLLVAAGVVGCFIGWWRPRLVVQVGLCVLVAAYAGAWMMPDQVWPALSAAIPLMAAGASIWAAGLRLAFVTPLRLAAVGLAGVAAITCGLVLALPLSWALDGDVPADTESLRAGARVLIGLCGALALMAAGFAAALVSRLKSAAAEHRPTVDLQDLSGRES